MGKRESQTEKLVPQPQDERAFGLLTLNAAPIRSSEKSTSAPFKKSRLTGSISTTAPSRSTTRSSSIRVSSSAKLYEKPEQPPPFTARRSITGEGSDFRISAIRRAARAEIVTGKAVSVVMLQSWHTSSSLM